MRDAATMISGMARKKLATPAGDEIPRGSRTTGGEPRRNPLIEPELVLVFQAKLRASMKAAAISQHAIESLVGRNQSKVNAWVNADPYLPPQKRGDKSDTEQRFGHGPRFDELSRLSRVLNVSLDYLCDETVTERGGVETPPPPTEGLTRVYESAHRLVDRIGLEDAAYLIRLAADVAAKAGYDTVVQRLASLPDAGPVLGASAVPVAPLKPVPTSGIVPPRREKP